MSLCPRCSREFVSGTAVISHRSKSSCSETPEERFWSKVDRRGADECWPWLAGRFAEGYGSFYVGRVSQRAHRIAYELVVGPIPDGLFLDHLCRVRHCVNPAHLEPVTNRENILRGQTLPAASLARTACPAGHPYSGANLYVAPRGDRRCRTCIRASKRAWMADRRAKTPDAAPIDQLDTETKLLREQEAR